MSQERDPFRRNEDKENKITEEQKERAARRERQGSFGGPLRAPLPASGSSSGVGLFQAVSDEKNFIKLLRCIAEADLDNAQRMVNENPGLILMRNPFVEIVGENSEYPPVISLRKYSTDEELREALSECYIREWDGEYSPLWYAAWTGNTELVDMFLACFYNLPDDDHKKNFLQVALRELSEVQRGTGHERYLDTIKQLIDRLEKYAHGQWDTERNRNEYWAEEIVKAQYRLTVNQIFFCSKERISIVPEQAAQACAALRTFCAKREQDLRMQISKLETALGKRQTQEQGPSKRRPTE